MPCFLFKLVAPRPDFSGDMSDAEIRMMQEHVAYWKTHQDKADVPVLGPVLDPAGQYGLGAVLAADEAAARVFAANDPALRANCGLACEIHSMRAVVREQGN